MAIPSFRVIPGTPFVVDGFRCRPVQQDRIYVLTHAHADHYGGITDTWPGGPIYCTEVTARLVHLLTGIPQQLLRPVPLDVPTTIAGVKVTFIDANHCPGAAQVLFELPDGRRYIHCGDMRYSPKLLDNQHLQRMKHANAVFLDNTYAHPRHAFPLQEDAVEFVAARIQQLLQEDEEAAGQQLEAGPTPDQAVQGQQQHPSSSPATGDEQQQQQQEQEQEQEQQGHQDEQQEQQDRQHQQGPSEPPLAADFDDAEEQQQAQQQLGFRRLYLISTYVIGKERLLLAVAARTGRKLLVTQKKLRLLRAIGLSESQLSSTFTTDPTATPIRVVSWGHLGDSWPYFRPNFTNMEADRTAAAAQEVVGFVPTGWTYEMRKAAKAGGPYPFPVRTKAACSVWLIPYSEHSSFPELLEYVGFLRPKQVIPTVGVGADGPETDKKVASILKHFRGLLDEAANKAAFIAKLTAAPAGGNGAPGRRQTRAAVKAAAAGSSPAAAAAAAAGRADILDLAVDHEQQDGAQGQARQLAASAADAADAVAATGNAAAAAVCEDADEGFWELPAEVAAAACADVMGCAGQQQVGLDDVEMQPPPLAGCAAQPVPDSAVQGAAPAATPDANADASCEGEADAGVQMLLSIAPAGSLTAAEAQQLLMAAAGDINAAVNAMLDRQARVPSPQQQQQQQTRGSPAPLVGKKRSSKGADSSTTAAAAGSSNKKARQQQKKGNAAAPGQSAITAFFTPNRAQVASQQQPQAASQVDQQQGQQVDQQDGSADRKEVSQQQQQQQQQEQQEQQSTEQEPSAVQRPAGVQLPGAQPSQRPPTVSPAVVVINDVSRVVLPPLNRPCPPTHAQQLQAQQTPVLQRLQQQQHPAVQQQQQPEQPAVKVVLPRLPPRTPSASRQGVTPAAPAGRGASGRGHGGSSTARDRQEPEGPAQQQQQQGCLQGPEEPEASVSQGQAGVKSAAAAWQALLPGSRRQQQQQQQTVDPSRHTAAPAPAGDTQAPEPDVAGQAPASPAAGVVAPAAAGVVAPAAAGAGGAGVAAGSGGGKAGSSSLSVTSTADVVSEALRQAPLLPLQRYNPANHAVWSPGQPAPYLALALTLAAVDATSKRTQMALALTNFFRSLMLLSPQDVVPAAYLLCGRMGPEYVSLELNLGGSVVSSALCEVCGVSRGQLREMYKQYGDLGDVAQACRRKQTLLQAPAPLTISAFFGTLHKLAGMSGQGANARRQAVVAKLLRAARDVETRYLVRTLIQCLRIGAGYRSVLPPLAKAALLHRSMLSDAARSHGADISSSGTPSATELAAAATNAINSARGVSKAQLDAASASVLAAYHRCPNIDIIADVLMRAGPEALDSQVQLSCGVPVKPMLARPCTGPADALKLLSGTAAAGASAAARGRVKPAAAAAARSGGAEAGAAAGGAGVLLASDEGDESDAEDEAAADSGSGDEAEMPSAVSAAAAAAAAAGAAAGRAAPSVDQLPQGTDANISSRSSLCVLAEFKYDGQRAQIHVSAEREVRIFSRNCDENTGAFPDVAAAMLSALDPQQLPVVLDTELVAVDRATGNRLRAFQELATRRRGSAANAAGGAGAAGGVGRGSSGGGGSSSMGPGAKSSGGAAAGLTTGSGGVKRGAAAAGLAGSSGGRKLQQQKLLLLSPATSGAQAQSTATSEGAAASAGGEAAGRSDQRQQGPAAAATAAGPASSGQAAGAGVVDVCVFVFDALCVGGRDLMGQSLRERRAAAAAALTTLTPGVVQLAQGIEVQVAKATATPAAAAAAAATAGAAAPAETSAAAAAAGGAADAVEADAATTPGAAAAAAAAAGGESDSWLAAEGQLGEYLFTALDAGVEGLMLKLLDGPASGYAPAQRGLSWLKLKRDYLEGLADSIDLVPIGAWYGQGRKVQWFSPFLLAVYDRHTETFQSLCRCMSGFTDEFYAAAKERLSAHIIPGPKPYYNTGESPSVWFEPTEVWEVRGADLSISPVHRAAQGRIHADRGIGLRFPRFLRIRPDKSVEDASGPDLIQQLYNKQSRRIHQD